MKFLWGFGSKFSYKTTLWRSLPITTLNFEEHFEYLKQNAFKMDLLEIFVVNFMAIPVKFMMIRLQKGLKLSVKGENYFLDEHFRALKAL